MPIDTKKIIATKFLEMSESKSIDKISVKELVLSCGLSRQAFYYHFQDILEVAVYANELRVQEILSASQNADNLETAMKIFVDFFSENLTVTRKQLESQKYRQFENLLNQMIKIFLKELILKSEKSMLPNEMEYALEYCTGGVYHMLMTYAGKSREQDEQLAVQLARLINGQLVLF